MYKFYGVPIYMFNYIILFCLISSIEIVINNNALIINFEGSSDSQLDLVGSDK